MPQINLLTKEVAELIAAGEVIERPSSIIKELLENSIDSGANSITVEIRRGGITYMRVTDNGCGIDEADVPKAFLRHATSKLRSKEDLDKIFTLGFRGEALASIAAVAKVEIYTKPAADEYGTHYVIEGTEEKLCEKAGCADGTTIVVRDIFYNVPARLKFLKKDVSEGNSIANIIEKIALSHPDISFKFIRDGKAEFYTSGDGDIFSTVYTVFGKQLAAAMLPVDYELNGIHVAGFTIKPLFGRAKRSFQNFFINGRYVRSFTCTKALEDAYTNSIMEGKFPACVLMINVPPDVVDVNVHPAKIEVRFSNDDVIYNTLYFAIKSALLAGSVPSEMSIPSRPKIDYTVYPQKPTPPPEQYRFAEPEKHAEPVKPVKVSVSVPTEVVPEIRPAAEPVPVEVIPEKAADKPAEPIIEKHEAEPKVCETPADIPVPSEETKIVSEDKPIDEPKEETSSVTAEEPVSGFKYINSGSLKKKSEPVLEIQQKEEKTVRLIGEAFKTYVIAECGDEVVFIDKHAAHERILFENIKARKQPLNSQMLLVPIEIMLEYSEYDALEESSALISELGFEIGFVKAPLVSIKGIPAILDGCEAEGLVQELAGNLLEHKHNPMPEVLDDMYHTFACKAAIKAHDTNSPKELMWLVKEVLSRDEIRYCPHGRPVMFKLTKYDFDKQFKRIV